MWPDKYSVCFPLYFDGQCLFYRTWCLQKGSKRRSLWAAAPYTVLFTFLLLKFFLIIDWGSNNRIVNWVKKKKNHGFHEVFSNVFFLDCNIWNLKPLKKKVNISHLTFFYFYFFLRKTYKRVFTQLDGLMLFNFWFVFSINTYLLLRCNLINKMKI